MSRVVITVQRLRETLDSHCNMDVGCVCGWTYDDTDKSYDDHLAESIIEAGEAR
jgi:hypothetical protein